jgi:hypothetical protein
MRRAAARNRQPLQAARTSLTKNAMRRRWKLQVMKSLGSELGIGISDIRRLLGKLEFDELVDEAYEASATDPEAGTKLLLEKILGKYGAELDQSRQ